VYYLYLEVEIIYLLPVSCMILILLDCQLIFKIVFHVKTKAVRFRNVLLYNNINNQLDATITVY